MRRFIALCLLMLLPLQFSWAAVASYCGHESAVLAQGAAEHLGHHEHQHAPLSAAAADTGAEQPSGPAAIDIDCAQCHGCCSGLPCAAAAATGTLGTTHPRAAADATASALAAAPPERPQWRRLA